MAQRYVEGQALLHACSSGRGIIVMVEGETDEHDAYFYTQWFGTMALEVSFYPQNGWKKVVDAVHYLRNALPPYRDVFGILDRDFVSSAVLAQQDATLPVDFIFRTQLYTVENYLLIAEGWFKVLRLLERGSLPPGWQTVAEVQAHIDDAYRKCMNVAAFNYTVRQEGDRLHGDCIEYKRHPQNLLSPESELLAWGQMRSAPQALNQVYQSHCEMIQGLAPNDWPIWISGKLVLKVFLESFPKKLQHRLLENLYINSAWPQPPTDLDALIRRLIDRRGHP
jgi:hypothetical protein